MAAVAPAAEVEFLDCSVGLFGAPDVPEVLNSREQLQTICGRYAIHQAIVYDRGAVESGMLSEFERVLKFCSDRSTFLPMVPIVPPACGEQPEPSELVRFLLDEEVAAVGVWPRVHNIDLDRYAFAALLSRLQEHRIPVVYHTMGRGDHPWHHSPDWRGLVDIAHAFADLPIIVTPTGMLQGRRALPVLAACPNVYLDLSCHTFRFVEHIVGAFGATRLVCTARLPYDDPGVTTSQLLYANVDPTARQAIAAGNVRQLLRNTG